MKCLVLAGGSGDRLWPLSRKNFPKQFMEIREGRSMFQEAILRNIPFCDEFIIVTNKKYENIVKGQLRDFQDLDYKLILEDIPLKTALSVTIVVLSLDKDDELLIVSTDHIIEGDYNSSITNLREEVNKDKIVVIGVKPTHGGTGYHYINRIGESISFGTRKSQNSYWDCGILGGKVSVFLQSLDEKFLSQAKKMLACRENIEYANFEKSLLTSLANVLKTQQMILIVANFVWVRITNISSFYNYLGKKLDNDTNSISYNNNNVEIVNTVKDQLVVACGIKDIVVTNTRDAVLITSVKGENDIKKISEIYYKDNSRVFNESPIVYENWGRKELLNRTDDCILSRIIIYPDKVFCDSTASDRRANYFITEGCAEVSYLNQHRDYNKYESILFQGQAVYEIKNVGQDYLVLIQTYILDKNPRKFDLSTLSDSDCFVKLKPIFKDFLWGGDKIRTYLGKDVGGNNTVAESWELSAHQAGQSLIANGKYKGFSFSEYIDKIGKDQLGWKAQAFEKFPIMIKFIDAKQNLSIQVHPDDNYAFITEGDYGKNEMWYIMEADDNAFIYVGFNRDVTEDEIRKRIQDDTLIEVLNKVKVRKGETYFLRTGLVHAIGAGCLICEIQQTSNVTYRLYDYGRKDKNGLARELHIDKALDVVSLKATSQFSLRAGSEAEANAPFRLLGKCKYFTANIYEIDGVSSVSPTDASFKVFVVVDGKGIISNGKNTYETVCGDTWFCGCRETIKLEGKFSVIAVNI